MFAGLFIWLLFTGTQIGTAILGGISFRVLIAFNRPFQVGDRVTLKGRSGKVVTIGVFHVSLQTPDDDLVSIPTSGLWNESLVSANAGDRASLCVMPFYIAPFADGKSLQDAENALWDIVQTSSFFAFTKPVQIYLSQTETAIVITAKAYVANTYDEPTFKSEVARRFLKRTAEIGVPLASARWREDSTGTSRRNAVPSGTTTRS